ncbi:hypothetical protein SCLCIDRAFT_1213644 [Scleroderma citrinum Foug A]|uniref:Uncharacterized protein n=1 Tax=Scleroderma citrinum Foug A TaxID=1036808 RepID=A0A0C3DTA7_9AGAM|nr:hypothetical protein SCLCIDRAFT_1213644 [Scleroderma citrinum Foug A]
MPPINLLKCGSLMDSPSMSCSVPAKNYVTASHPYRTIYVLWLLRESLWGQRDIVSLLST